MWKENVLTKLKYLVDDPESELVVSGLRVLACLSKGSKERVSCSPCQLKKKKKKKKEYIYIFNFF